MFKSSSIAFALFLALQAHGHALIKPDLNGGTVRNDVTNPSTAAPCGAGVDIASLIDKAQTVPVTNGAVDATITNFNAGTDGSRFVTAQIDPTGTGKSFQAATVTTNGDKAPTDVGSQPLVVQVPAGVTASGGATGNKMLVAFKTLGGFGNCVVATTGSATGTGATGNSTSTTDTGTGTGKKQGGGRKKAGAGAGTGKAQTGAGAGSGKAAGGKGKQHKAGAAQKKHRQIQKLKLRNAINAVVDTN